MQNLFLSIGMYGRFTMVACFDENMPQSGVGSMQGSTAYGRLPMKVIFHQRSSSTKSHLPPKVVFC